MKNNSIFLILGFFLIILQVFVITQINLFYYNSISCMFLFSYFCTLIWINRSNRAFKLLKVKNIIVILLLLFEAYFSNGLFWLEILGLITFYYYIKIEYFIQEINIASFTLLIIFFGFLEIIKYFTGYIFVQNYSLQFNIINFYHFLITIFLNVIITLFLYKILKKRKFLVYN